MKKLWTWCINNLIVVIPILLVIFTTPMLIASFKKDDQKVTERPSENTEETHFSENNQENITPNIPCLSDEPNLVFHHEIPDIKLSANQNECTIPLDYGYEVRWCCYNGAVSQYIDHARKTMTLRRTAGEPTLQIRYYVVKD